MKRELRLCISFFVLFFTSVSWAAKFTDSGQQLVGLNQTSIAWGDYDKDNDLDLAICGRNADGPQTLIYRNDTGILTHDTKQQLIGISYGKIGWTDYDSDGDLDLSLAGYDASVCPTSKIYTNVNGTLTEDPEQHPAIGYGSIAWADSDKDGKQDIYAHAGHDSNWKPYTKLFKKKEDGTTEEIVQNLISMYYGSVAWGDYTGDSRLDLLVTGWTPEGGIIKIYKDVNGTLVEDIDQKVEPAFHSFAVWADYDLDGDVDLFITGQGKEKPITKVYRNDNGILIEDTSQELPGVSFSALAPCDYDKDGDLDLILSGALADKTTITKLFLNDAAIPIPIHHIEILSQQEIFKGGSFTTDNTLDLLAKAYSQENNLIGDVVVHWQINPESGIFSKEKGVSSVLDLIKVGTATIIAYDNQGHTATAEIKIDAGECAFLKIEDEKGNEIGNLSLTADDELIVYAMGYDKDTNTCGLELVHWEIIGDIGSLSTTYGTSTIFYPGKGAVGEGMIKIWDDKGHTCLTGTITTLPGITNYVRIEDTSGKEIGDLETTTDKNHLLFAYGYDKWGNDKGPVEVVWSITGNIGTLSTTQGTMTIFEPLINEKGTITIIELSSGLTDSTGLITVLVGNEHHLVIVDKNNQAVESVILTADDKLEIFAKTFDAKNLEIGVKEVRWTLIGNIGNLSTTTGTGVILDFTTVGTGCVVAESSLSDMTEVITVLPGRLHHFVFNTIDDQIVEIPFEITVTAKDEDGNTVTGYNGTSNTFADTTETIDYDKTVKFIDGVLSNHPVTISNACGSVTILTYTEETEGESNRFAVLGGSICGNISDELGNRLANILIEAYLTFENGTSTLKGSTTTLPDGSYLIAGLPPGTYEVRVVPPKGYQTPEAQVVNVEVVSTKGRLLVMALSGINFVLAASIYPIEDVFVWPNPVHPPHKMTFSKLAGRSGVIKIFNIAGELVKKIPFNDNATWDVTNEDNRTVASGIYIYLIIDTNTGEKKTGKLGVIK
ncbi:MAG: FG-GAP-like repeat-containing protein [bacterium]